MSKSFRIGLFMSALLAVAGTLGAIRIYQAAHKPNAHSAVSVSTGSYQCPMHTSYRSDAPGKCPVCDMNLVLAGARESEARESGRSSLVRIDAQTQRRAGIKIETVTRRAVQRSIRATGQIVVDSSTVLNANASGTVSRVFVLVEGNNPASVSKGQPILEVEGNGRAGIVAAPSTGWVTLLTKAGANVEAANAVASFWNLDPVAVIGEIPLDEIRHVNVGARAEMTTVSEPGLRWNGSVSNVFSAYDARLRTVKIKLLFPNQSRVLRSNMPVELRLFYSSPKVLSVPANAVLWNGERWFCYVPDASGFIRKQIDIGAQFDGYYEVRAGLRENDRVAAGAAFLIDSESQLRERVQ